MTTTLATLRMVTVMIMTLEDTTAMNITMIEQDVEVTLRAAGMGMIEHGEVRLPSVATMEMEIEITVELSALEVAVHRLAAELHHEGIDAVALEEVEAKAWTATSHIAREEIATHEMIETTLEVKVRLAIDGGIEMASEAAADKS